MRLLSSSVLFLLSLLAGIPVSAQTSVSVMGGLNWASLEVEDASVDFPVVFRPVKRMSVGLAATFPIAGRFEIQLDGTYSQKGGLLDVERMLEILDRGAGYGIAEFRAEMSYLELALLARTGFPLPGQRASGHLLAGPVLAWLTSCREGILGDRCDDMPFNPKKLDMGVAGGAGIEIELTEALDASAGLLYALGLREVSNAAAGAGPYKLWNRALTFRVGLSFPIG